MILVKYAQYSPRVMKKSDSNQLPLATAYHSDSLLEDDLPAGGPASEIRYLL
jgi:hypothetical protein